jgi:hypothetical protein
MGEWENAAPEEDAFKVSTLKGSYNVGDNGCVVR